MICDHARQPNPYRPDKWLPCAVWGCSEGIDAPNLRLAVLPKRTLYLSPEEAEHSPSMRLAIFSRERLERPWAPLPVDLWVLEP